MELTLPLRSRSAFCLVGVLPSASRPCRTHFFVAPHPATPNNKKRLPFGNLLLLLERAMGLALPLRPRSVSPRRRTFVRLSSLSNPLFQGSFPCCAYNKKNSQKGSLFCFGTRAGIRTLDPLIKSQLL